MEFRVLGPLEVVADGVTLPLGGVKQRSVLAVLVLSANHVVSTDRLVEAVWGESPHERAGATLQVYVSNLRKLLEPERGRHRVLVSQPPGYLLRVEPDRVDLLRFETMAAQARKDLANDRHEPAARGFRAALALWRGQPLADLAFQPFASAEVGRLEEARVAAVEDRVEADLAVGRHADLVGELETLVAEHPLRERLWAHLMVALYRGGCQADALRAYGRARHTLVEEYGIDPGPALRELEGRILAQDPGLAPPRSTGRAPVVLPAPPSALVGRRAELAGVADRLRRDDVRLLTLTGAGGTGKTRLALAAAGAVTDDFPGGVYFVPLAAVTDPALLLSAVAQVLDLPEAPGQPLLETVATALGSRPVLLVLDNLEQLLDGGSDVAALLRAAAALTVLATSRAPLRVSGEHEQPLPPLGLPDLSGGESLADVVEAEAVQLFVERTRSVCPDFRLDDDSARAVAQICVQLDGLPLAIELAAARMKVLSLAALLTRLERRLSLLTGGPRDLPGRQRTLRATLDWSHDLLGPAERLLLARLAVFAGSFTLAAAEAVCAGAGADEADLVDGLAALVDNSLVRPLATRAEMRFQLLRTVREYALERLADGGEELRLRSRHAGHFRQVVEAAAPGLDGPDAAALLDRLDTEQDDVRAALRHALDSDDVGLAARIALPLRMFWLARGRLSEGRSCLAAVLAAGPGEPDRTAVSVAAGILAYHQDEHDAARSLLADGLAAARRQGAAAPVAVALCFLGALRLGAGDPAGARVTAEEAARLAAADGGYEPAVLALSLAALIAAREGRPGEEEARYTERLSLAQRRGDRARVADTLNTLADIALDRGAVGEARSRVEEALPHARLTNRLAARDVLLTLGRVALAEGAVQRAVQPFVEAAAASLELGQGFELAQALRGLAAVAASAGADTKAATLDGAAVLAAGECELPPQPEVERPLAAARGRLGAEAYEAAARAGARLSRELAVAVGTGDAQVGLP